ncbi:MAG TPA: hypothetical protein VG944_14970, partial [Fimbriimonas sp.]|nr:hypothetical protein [Fimbriimonas sp.]
SWKLGEPDMILEMPKAYHVPADGNDIYRNFVIPVHIPDDVYIRAVDFEPSCRAVVHHCLFYFDTTGLARQADGVDGQPGYDGSVGAVLGPKSRGDEADSFGSSVKGLKAGNLGGWAVGAQPEQLPEGLAYTLPKGADVILATHFHLDGKPEVEKSKIGLYFAKKPPTKEFASLLLPPIFGFFSNLDIPAGQKDYTLIDSFTLPVAVKAFSVSAHAHYLGKDFQLTATLPDGAVKNLFTIPKWDFNWQGGYRYQDYVSLPAGTKLTSTMHYDNSSDNVNNPSNPPKHVKWGEQSTDEMGSLILSVVPEKDGDMESLKKAYMTHLINTITAHDGWKKIQEMQKKKQGQ